MGLWCPTKPQIWAFNASLAVITLPWNSSVHQHSLIIRPFTVITFLSGWLRSYSGEEALNHTGWSMRNLRIQLLISRLSSQTLSSHNEMTVWWWISPVLHPVCIRFFSFTYHSVTLLKPFSMTNSLKSFSKLISRVTQEDPRTLEEIGCWNEHPQPTSL